MSSDAVNVRISGDTADALAQRASTVGISRQELIDQVLRREVIYGSEGWARPVEVAPGLLPLAEELARGSSFAFIYRDLATNGPVILAGRIAQLLPTALYVQPPAHRMVAIARALLIAWQPYADINELWEVIPQWFYAGAKLHPTIPQHILHDLLGGGRP